ncbi:MAG: protein kinase [Burkholderiales bacterium]
MSAVAARIEPQSFVLGRYEVRERLGEGGMGTVYRGQDPVLDRPVAIKTINLTMAKEDLPDYEARFYQEARAAGGLAQANIVVIYDIGKTDRHAYMVMEYVQGRVLREFLVEHGALGHEDAVDICSQVADGLAYAHTRGIIHRDIKPTNIMITDEGVVKITDFGIARMRSSEVKTMTGLVLGSPRYMSPEQVTGGTLDPRTDVFSLGIVLYELLTGRSPFQADNIHAAMFQALNTTPAPPSRVNQNLPRILDFIVAKAIAKDPDNRYRDAAQMAADLRSSLGQPPRRRPLSVLSQGPAPASGAGTGGGGSRRTEDVTGGGNTSTTTVSLSGAFDSSAATLRLTAIANEGGSVIGSAPFPQAANTGSMASAEARQRADRVAKITPWLWLGSLVALGLAAYLFVR